MKSSQLPHCCWLKFALLFVTRRARKDWWAKHRLECTRQGFASSHVWNDHNWLKFARTQAVSLCAKSNQTNIDQQRTALTREGGAVNPELLFLIDYSPPWYAYIMFVSDISKKIRNVCVLLHRRSKRTVEVGVPVFFQLKIVFSRIFVFLPVNWQATYTFSRSPSSTHPLAPHPPFLGFTQVSENGMMTVMKLRNLAGWVQRWVFIRGWAIEDPTGWQSTTRCQPLTHLTTILNCIIDRDNWCEYYKSFVNAQFVVYCNQGLSYFQNTKYCQFVAKKRWKLPKLTLLYRIIVKLHSIRCVL